MKNKKLWAKAHGFLIRLEAPFGRFRFRFIPELKLGALRSCIKPACKSRWRVSLLAIIVILAVVFLLASRFAHDRLMTAYKGLESPSITDRSGQVIAILPNARDDYDQFIKAVPDGFEQALLKKEDQYFYFHPGFNPVSLAQAFLARFGLGQRPGASTITQQLVKVLLANEADRSAINKVAELFYSVALELYESKNDILLMYSNAAYFGNQARGLKEAGLTYFGQSPEALTATALAQLAATISAPNTQNPILPANHEATQLLVADAEAVWLEPAEAARHAQNRQRRRPDYFEAQALLTQGQSCRLSLDLVLNAKIREVVNRILRALRVKAAGNAAVVVIDLPENNLIGLVGSPDPAAQFPGYQINMAVEPRAIGSTIKPLIYAKAFEKGARPYSLIDDKEYKYLTALGLPLYPKNFDYQYRGLVTAHYALSNSLNVPAVKTLEFVGVAAFSDFLVKNLGFTPVQPLAEYQLGIALGALEMNLLDLSRYFTIFPNQGSLKPLQAGDPTCVKGYGDSREILKPPHTALINKILSDRQTGSEQFGLKSVLNLPRANYALKTGTSRDYRDSWVIGFSPDFLVGVWVGNADLSPMDSVSGQMGAGQIWADAMNLLYASEYNRDTPFDFKGVVGYQTDHGLEWGLANDNFDKARQIMLDKNEPLITFPHEGDTFLYEAQSELALQAREPVEWFVDKYPLGPGAKVYFKPRGAGAYQIKAVADDGASQILTINFRTND